MKNETDKENQQPQKQSSLDFWTLSILKVVVGTAAVLVATGLFLLTQHLYRHGQFSKRSMEVRTIFQFRSVQTRLDAFRAQCGSYPTTEQGLKLLATKPPFCPNWEPIESFANGQESQRDASGGIIRYSSDGKTFRLESNNGPTFDSSLPDGGQIINNSLRIDPGHPRNEWLGWC